MDTLMHADIFFFVTTVAVILVALLLVVILIYVIKILNDLKRITGHVQEETVLIREDIKELRSKAKGEGLKWLQITSFFKNIIKRKTSRSK